MPFPPRAGFQFNIQNFVEIAAQRIYAPKLFNCELRNEKLERLFPSGKEKKGRLHLLAKKE